MNDWRSILARNLPGGRSRVVALALTSAAGGLAEAAVLVLAVQMAVGISQGADVLEMTLPIAGDLSFSMRTAILTALVAACVVGVLHVVSNLIAARLSSTMLANVRERMLRAYGGASWDRQARENEGALQESVSSLATSSSLLVLSTSHALSALLSLAALTTGALLIEPLSTVVVVLIGGGLFLSLRPLRTMTRRHSTSYVGANSGFNEGVTQMSSLGFELRSFGVDTARVDGLVAQSEVTSRSFARSQFATRLGQHLYRDVALLILVAAIGALNLIDTVSLASVGSVVLLMLRSLGSVQDINGAIHSIQHQRPNLEAFEARLADLEADSNPAGHVEIDSIGVIELESVTYRYEVDAAPALDSVDLRIPHGEMLGVVGPSGGGKSTLVQLLLRLRFPSDGDLIVDGVPLIDVTAESWQRLAAVVPQTSRLLAGSVRDNIAFHRPLSHDQVVEAARMANIAAEIEALPNGYDTMLGPRGSGLSGGQSQRLAIARALVGQPQLLILDEPTSALDVHSEAALQRTIDGLAGTITMVIIAHRLSTIAACDRLVILDRGRVEAIGTQAEVHDHPFLKDRMG